MMSLVWFLPDQNLQAFVRQHFCEGLPNLGNLLFHVNVRPRDVTLPLQMINVELIPNR